MKRTFVVLVLSLAAAIAVSASYKIYLVSGEIVVADEKPVVKDGLAYFDKLGLTYSLPPSSIDFDKSEKAALAAAAAPAIEQYNTRSSLPKTAKPKPVMKVDDRSIEEIRQRARLANEDELSPPGEDQPSATEAPGTGDRAETPKKAAQNRAEAQQRLSDLEGSLAQAEDARNQARTNVQSLKDQYDTAIQQDQRESLSAQLDSAQQGLDAANARANDASAQVRSARDILNSTPVVVELPNQPK